MQDITQFVPDFPQENQQSEIHKMPIITMLPYVCSVCQIDDVTSSPVGPL